jgi:carboxyl-terminal processing protease
VPDIIVEQSRVEKVASGERQTEADLPGALVGEDTGATPTIPTTPPAQPEGDGGADANPAPVAPVVAEEDYQLARAIDLLHGLALFRAQGAN